MKREDQIKSIADDYKIWDVDVVSGGEAGLGVYMQGFRSNPNFTDDLYVYGSDQDAISRMMEKESSISEKLNSQYEYTVAEVIWAVLKEMARSVEDVLVKRVRLLFQDYRVAVDVAPKVAVIMAEELGHDQA